MFVEPVISFVIETPTREKVWKVFRSIYDFNVLRDVLLNQQPDTIVPALP